MKQFNFLQGEEKYVEFCVQSCRDTLLVITEALYELTLNGNLVESGAMHIDGDTIKTLLSPSKLGVYDLEVTVVIPPETIKASAFVSVRER